MENKELNVAHKDYDFTVLTCLFAGTFGLHRLLNGRFVSGGILFGITVFSLLLALVPIIGFFGIIMLMFTMVWAIIDLLLISTNNFKNKKNEIIGYHGNYFKNQANIVVIIVIAITTIVAISIALSFFISVQNITELM